MHERELQSSVPNLLRAPPLKKGGCEFGRGDSFGGQNADWTHEEGGGGRASFAKSLGLFMATGAQESGFRPTLHEGRSANKHAARPRS